jgi:LPXTG-motif cell wall-anchored protein
MKRFKFVAMICSFVFVALAITPRVKADEWNNKSFLTFSEPIEVPGVGAQILPAGKYMFKLVDSLSDRDIVQIFSADGLHLYTTILAIPDYRLKATGKTVMTFKERGEGQPEAIKAWFYPGKRWGQEFVYPKKRAIELAKIVKEPVLETPIEVVDIVPVETLRTAPVAAIQPTGEEVPVTAVVQSPPATVANQAPSAAVAATPPATEVAENLPKTASSLPLFALIGMLSLFAGFTLLIISRRSA